MQNNEIRSQALTLRINQFKLDKDLNMKFEMLKQPEGNSGQHPRDRLREGPQEHSDLTPARLEVVAETDAPRIKSISTVLGFHDNFYKENV